MSRTFTQTALRRGYDEREVDEFLDQVVATLLLGWPATRS